MEIYDVIVIGGGAAGLTAAIAASECGDRAAILEAGNRIGRKILASGNGRCNLMNENYSSRYYHGDPAFADSVFKRCGISELKKFWHRYGLKIRADSAGRMYPASFQSATVLDICKDSLEKNHCDVFLSQRVEKILSDGDLFHISTDNSRQFLARRVIVAAGGPAQPSLGGSFSGYHLLTDCGHHLVNPMPALCPLITEPRFVSGLAGIRVKCRISVINDGVVVHSEKGELLFTRDGISGICAMQCSRYILPGISVCTLDLADDLYASDSEFLDDLMRLKEMYPTRSPISLIQGICLPRMAFAICKQAGFSMRKETNADLSGMQMKRLIDSIHNYRLPVTGLKGFDQAQISAGGIQCDEFCPENMMSVFTRNLHAAGEVLNVDGDCGGYNLMFAFSSGLLAGWNGRVTLC